MARKRIYNVLLGLVVCSVLSSTGCGRGGQRSSLLPRVDVADIMSGDTAPDAPSEQYVNNQIDEQLRRTKSGLDEAKGTVLASAEKEVDSWKKILPGSRKSDGPAEVISKDPFLDSIDEIIAKDADSLAESSRDSISASVDRALDRISNTDAAEMFADLPEQARQQQANLSQAATQAIAQATASTTDVFGAAQEDVFGAPEAVVEQATNRVRNGLEQVASAADQRRQSFSQGTGSTVHRFDELFDEAESTVQQVANETREVVSKVADAARFETSEPVASPFEDPAPSIAEEFVVAKETAVEEIKSALVEQFDATADMFEPPVADTRAPEQLPELPTLPVDELPELPAMPGGLRVAATDQQDAVVTPNAPATLPNIPEDLPTEMSADFGSTAMDRISVDANDPIFTDPDLPDVDEVPEVTIPDVYEEPAPRFTEIEVPERAQLTQRAPTSRIDVPVRNASATRPVAASVLPDVDWQGQQPTAKSNLRAPSEWTAWFLMGGAALIILLLFAPTRRES